MLPSDGFEPSAKLEPLAAVKKDCSSGVQDHSMPAAITYLAESGLQPDYGLQTHFPCRAPLPDLSGMPQRSTPTMRPAIKQNRLAALNLRRSE